jgi:hypothetical protein
MVAAKQCSKCKIVKTLNEFFTDRRQPDQSTYRCKECHAEYQKAFKASGRYKPTKVSPEKRRARHLKKRYGVTPEQADAMRKAQDNRCAICGNELGSKQRTHIDHDHLTGKLRKILCNPCNRGIGYLQDSPEILLKAAQYLQSHAS